MRRDENNPLTRAPIWSTLSVSATEPAESEATKMKLREFEHIVSNSVRPGGVCHRCDKQLEAATCYWGDDAPFTVTTGQRNSTQRFPVLRHADGTAGHGPEGSLECYAAPTCPDCGALRTLRTKQEAYGDRVTCTACGHEHYYSIGD